MRTSAIVAILLQLPNAAESDGAYVPDVSDRFGTATSVRDSGGGNAGLAGATPPDVDNDGDLDPDAAVTGPSFAPGQAGRLLPFRTNVRFTGELIAIGDADSAARCNAFGLFTLTGSFAGQATHLGNVTGAFSNCTMVPIPGPVDIMAGEVTIIAASGERLLMTYFGTQEAVNLQTFTAEYAVSYEIIGGTGRFDNASGMLEASGVVDFNPGGLSSEVAEGWIRFDASNARQ